MDWIAQAADSEREREREGERERESEREREVVSGLVGGWVGGWALHSMKPSSFAPESSTNHRALRSLQP